MTYELNKGNTMIIIVITDEHKSDNLFMIGDTNDFNMIDGSGACWPDSYHTNHNINVVATSISV